MAKCIVTDEQHFVIDGLMLEIKRQLRLKSGSLLEPAQVIIALQDIIKGSKTNAITLRLISGGEKLIIEVPGGKRYVLEDKTSEKIIPVRNLDQIIKDCAPF